VPTPNMTIELTPVKEHPQFALIVERCTQDLFEAHGIEVTRQAAGPDEFRQGSCGIVRIAGKHCELTLLLMCHRGLLRRTHPGRVLMRDWVGELANQLAGRIKHGLWNHGAGSVYQTTPAVVDAKHIRMDAEGPSSMAPLHFVANHYPAVVLVDGFLDGALSLKPQDVEPYIAEGGLVML